MKCRRDKNSKGSRLRGGNLGAAPGGPEHDATTQSITAQLLTVDAESAAALLQIDGAATGPVHHAGTVHVGLRGAITGNVYASRVVVEGSVSGDIQALIMTHIAATATVVGDVVSPRVALDRGAQLRGTISMRGSVLPPADLDETGVDDLLAGSGRV